MSRDAFIDRLQNPEGMGRINAPWRHAGNGELIDAEGLPVAYMSNFHEAQIPLVLATPKMLAAAKGMFNIPDKDHIDALLRLQLAIAAAEEPASLAIYGRNSPLSARRRFFARR